LENEKEIKMKKLALFTLFAVALTFLALMAGPAFAGTNTTIAQACPQANNPCAPRSTMQPPSPGANGAYQPMLIRGYHPLSYDLNFSMPQATPQGWNNYEPYR